MNNNIYFKNILLIALLFLLITFPVKADNDYNVFLVKDHYFAVDFKNDKKDIELIFPDGQSRILTQKRSASGIRFCNENITFWNKGDQAQIYINDIILDAKVKKYSEEIRKHFPKTNKDEYIYFKTQGFYIFFLEPNRKNKIVISGREADLEKVSENKYIGNKLEVFENNNTINLKIDGYKFSGDSVNFDNLINNSNLVIRGLGQEPGWFIDIYENEIKLKLDYAQVSLDITQSQYTKKFLNNKIYYDIKTSLFDFEIIITKNMHSDIMSGFKFPFTIKIKNNKNTLVGGAYIKELN